jgi:integrase
MPQTTKQITAKVIEALAPGEQVWDSKIAGFGVRRQKKACVYVLKKRINGRQRWISIGKHGEPWTPSTARREAQTLLGDIAKGKDPALEREARKSRPTVSALCDRYLDEHAREHKKQSSIATDESNIRNHIKPLLGKRLVADLTIADIDKFKRDVKQGKTAKKRVENLRGGTAVKGGTTTANRCLALLSKSLNLAIKWGLRPDNPATHVSKYKENKIERFLSEREFAALGDALRLEQEAGTNLYAIAAIRLLIFTGARRGEILTLRWKNVDLNRGMINLEDSKTGKKSIFLSTPAQELLASLPRQKKNPYVICGAKDEAHLINLRKVWDRVRKRATLLIWQDAIEVQNCLDKQQLKALQQSKFQAAVTLLKNAGLEPTESLTDLRIHDLRHSFASVAAMGGLSLPVIGKLLGHTQASTTARYAHLADDPLMAANEAIGRQLAEHMSGQQISSQSENRRVK